MTSKQFFYDLGKALYYIDYIYNEFSKKYDISPTTLWVLYALNDGKEHTQHEICQSWMLPKSTVNMAISELKVNGYVNLSKISGKRREMHIVLTNEGISYSEEVLKDIYKKENDAFLKLTSDDKNIVNVLNKISNLLTK